MRKIEGVCKVDGCGRSLKARGYCNTHYAQVKRNGAITASEINTRMSVIPECCTMPDCEGAVKSKGLCAMHYARLLRHGYVKNPDRTKPFQPCSFPGCVDHLVCSDFCNRHYLKVRKYQQDHLLSFDEVMRLLETMPKLCELCGLPQTTRNGTSRRVHDFYLDHDHKTGRLRGWLCNRCNIAIGCFRSDDGVTLLQAAIRYVETNTVTIPPPPKVRKLPV
jgi:hypothetical protein